MRYFTKRADVASKQVPVLSRQDDILVDKIVVSLCQMNLSTVLSLACSNGTIDFHDRASMKLIEADENFGKVSSLQQLGFSFSSDETSESSTSLVRKFL